MAYWNLSHWSFARDVKLIKHNDQCFCVDKNVIFYVLEFIFL